VKETKSMKKTSVVALGIAATFIGCCGLSALFGQSQRAAREAAEGQQDATEETSTTPAQADPQPQGEDAPSAQPEAASEAVEAPPTPKEPVTAKRLWQQLKWNLSKVKDGDGDQEEYAIYSIKRGVVQVKQVTGDEQEGFVAELIIVVAGCPTRPTFDAARDAVLKEVIAYLPPEVGGYTATLEYNDQLSCSGRLSYGATWTRAENKITVE